jgi:hypothetical protein
MNGYGTDHGAVNDGPHCTTGPTGHSPAWRIFYWNGNVASGKKGASRADVEVFSHGHGGGGWCRFMSFILPIEAEHLEDCERNLIRVHNAGKEARNAEIRKLLGVT